MKPAFLDFVGAALGALCSIWPAQFAEHFITFSLINEVFEVDGCHSFILPTYFAFLLDSN